MREPGRHLDWTLLGTPMTLGLARADPAVVPGVADLAPALRRAGLAAALDARDAGDIEAPTDYHPGHDTATGVLNAPAVARHARRLADAIAPLFDRDEVPLLLGGDCSILLGPLLALRRRGRYGLVHLDGHTDFYPPASSASGQAAAMELWLAVGGEPAALSDLEGRRPLVRPEDAVLVGYRDHAERLRSGAPDPAAHLGLAIPCEEVLAGGAARAGARAVEVLRDREVGGVWLHFDADVLDDEVMPAVDSREPGGLSPGEATSIVAAVAASGLLCGLTVTIYDPTLDPGGRAARVLVETLAAGLAPAASS